MSSRGAELADRILSLRWADVPSAVQQHLDWLLLDFTAVVAAGRAAPAAAIAVDYADAAHNGAEASALLDGRPLSGPGAAFANGVLANAIDYDDGHRLTKGHPGACVIPAALAAGEIAGVASDDVRLATLIGYEVAIRAGISLHRREHAYHASGAWGAVGAAAACGRLLDLDHRRLTHALGLAEYHAPISPIMRSVSDPAMTKDAVGWGALLGVDSAMLARSGFTSLTGEFAADIGDVDLGGRWHVLDVYVKAYPCCRWVHPAIRAAIDLRTRHDLELNSIESVTIRTFDAAAALASVIPRTTEEAQYNLVWPVSIALAHGGVDVEHILDGFSDPEVTELFKRTKVIVDAGLTTAFPAQRRSEVTVTLSDGNAVDSGLYDAPGDPGASDWHDVIAAKARRCMDADPHPRLVELLAPGQTLGLV